MSDIDIPKDTGDFRLIDRKVADVFKQMTERNRFVRGMMSWIGFRQTYIEYERDERFAGETKYPLKKMIKFASDGIIAFSTKPLRMVMTLGLISVLISIAVLIYSVIVKLLDKTSKLDGLLLWLPSHSSAVCNCSVLVLLINISLVFMKKVRTDQFML